MNSEGAPLLSGFVRQGGDFDLPNRGGRVRLFSRFSRSGLL